MTPEYAKRALTDGWARIKEDNPRLMEDVRLRGCTAFAGPPPNTPIRLDVDDSEKSVKQVMLLMQYSCIVVGSRRVVVGAWNDFVHIVENHRV